MRLFYQENLMPKGTVKVNGRSVQAFLTLKMVSSNPLYSQTFLLLYNLHKSFHIMVSECLLLLNHKLTASCTS